MNFLPEKKYGVPTHNFVKKNVFCEKGDELPDLTVPISCENGHIFFLNLLKPISLKPLKISENAFC
jgi:hypothetical protein